MAIFDEGRIAIAKRIILRQGCKRFGPPDESTTATLSAIEDLERLEDLLFNRMLDGNTNSWQDLLKE